MSLKRQRRRLHTAKDKTKQQLTLLNGYAQLLAKCQKVKGGEEECQQQAKKLDDLIATVPDSISDDQINSILENNGLDSWKLKAANFIRTRKRRRKIAYYSISDYANTAIILLDMLNKNRATKEYILDLAELVITDAHEDDFLYVFREAVLDHPHWAKKLDEEQIEDLAQSAYSIIKYRIQSALDFNKDLR